MTVLTLIADGLSTLMATLVGAGIALWGSRWLFDRQSRADYHQRLDEALSQVLREAGELYDERQRRASRMVTFSTPIFTDPQTAAAAASLAPRSVEPLRTSLNVAELGARGEDRMAVRELTRLVDTAGDTLTSALGEVRRLILDWRSDSKSPAEVVDEIGEIIARNLSQEPTG